MSHQLEQVLLEKLDNNGNRTGEFEKYPRVSAEVMLKFPNSRWALAEEKKDLTEKKVSLSKNKVEDTSGTKKKEDAGS